MKNLFLLTLIFFLTTNISFAAPNYDPNYKTKIYDDSYNQKLFKKLNDEFEKKYPATLTYDEYGNPIYTYYNRPLNAYRDEVITPYDKLRDNTYNYIEN